jgi:hypothetical protein
MKSDFDLYIVPKGSEYYEHNGQPTTFYTQSGRVDINHFKKVAKEDFIVQIYEVGICNISYDLGYNEYNTKEVAWWGSGHDNGPRCVVLSSVLQPYVLKWSDGTAVTPNDYYEVPKGASIDVTEGQYDNVYKPSIAARKQSGPITASSGVVGEWNHTNGADGKGPGFYFYWGDVKRVRIENAIKGVVPEPKPEKVKVPTVRDYMIPNSKWQITGDLDVKDLVRRPNYAFENVLYTTLHAGDLITITGKFRRALLENNLIIPVKLPDGTTHFIAYDELKDVVKQIGEVEIIPEYFIYDTLAQKYYSGSEYHGGLNGRNDTLTYVEKLSKARKFKRLGDVRAHALVQSGYYDGLPGAENLPDWMRGGKAFNVPDTWEIHEINKLTKLVVRKIELVDTFKRTWSLRGLTLKYGSAVRAVFSDLDKKNQLDEFSAVLVFAKRKSNNQYYDDFELNDKEKEEIAEAISNIDKKELKSSKSYGAHAFAIKDSSTGIMIRLTYSGDLECKVIDLHLMAEVVGEELGASEISEQIKES